MKEFINKIICGDSLDIMKQLPDNSVDLVLTDPPYLGIVGDEWDNQWEAKQDFIDWLELYTKEWKRVLKDNGSLYIFGDDKMIAYVQVMIDKYFKLENSIVWFKPNNLPIKGWAQFNSYATATERLLFYSNEVEQTGLQIINNDQELYKPIRDYFKEQREIVKHISYNEINKECFGTASNGGGMASNILTSYKDGWTFPTKEKYEALQTLNICLKPYDNLRLEYDNLRLEYDNLRLEYEELRRPFKPAENFTDVWTFPLTAEKEKWAGKHPTIKPLQIFKRIIETSSREGDIILDCFGGSGTTAVACLETNRKYIVIEKEPKYCEIAEKRVKNTTPPLFTI